MKSRVTHTVRADTQECLGIYVWLWCPGCDHQHTFVFRCPEHGGPTGVVWEGDPYSDPPNFPSTPTSSNSLMTYSVNDAGEQVACHSFVKEGYWEFLPDCTAHELRGLVPLVDLPDWLASDGDD